jgi:hypothetical protein
LKFILDRKEKATIWATHPTNQVSQSDERMGILEENHTPTEPSSLQKPPNESGNEQSGAAALLLADEATNQKKPKSAKELEAERKSNIRGIWRNLLVFSVSIFFVFSASNSINMLQSSVNSKDGLGVRTLQVISISFTISCLFLPSLMAKYCGFKWPLVFSELCMGLYVLANFYPSFYTLLPAAVLFGCATSVVWTFQGSLISHLATEYSQLTGGKLDMILIKFLGIFYIIYQSRMNLSFIIKRRKNLNSFEHDKT